MSSSLIEKQHENVYKPWNWCSHAFLFFRHKKKLIKQNYSRNISMWMFCSGASRVSEFLRKLGRGRGCLGWRRGALLNIQNFSKRKSVSLIRTFLTRVLGHNGVSVELGKGVFSEWRENLELSKCTHFRTLLEIIVAKM